MSMTQVATSLAMTQVATSLRYIKSHVEEAGHGSMNAFFLWKPGSKKHCFEVSGKIGFPVQTHQCNVPRDGAPACNPILCS